MDLSGSDSGDSYSGNSHANFSIGKFGVFYNLTVHNHALFLKFILQHIKTGSQDPLRKNLGTCRQFAYDLRLSVPRKGNVLSSFSQAAMTSPAFSSELYAILCGCPLIISFQLFQVFIVKLKLAVFVIHDVHQAKFFAECLSFASPYSILRQVQDAICIQSDMQNTVFTDLVDPSEYFQSNT
ncbi:hypothetical protein MJG53_016343 [Ovis ammon polii x Ovis aries]|uniref:Uncharacterized protein n=1 Tax=Ovis ammon polii x Ovis aries TaxID=2918886 RepID=A0ACB9UB91_9CETA|nr:hypothetical protein MJG53_016343 [Ovis ammon polii x Ovis aries]